MSEQADARGALPWLLLFLGALFVPLVAVLATVDLPGPVRLATGLVALAVLDAPLVRAGTTGRGPGGVVQPWRWTQYLPWLAVRLVLVVGVVAATWEA